MALFVEGSPLRVVRNLSRLEEHDRYLRSARLIVLEHILPTTEAFLRHLREGGVDIYCVLAKPYSKDPDVLKRLRESGLRVEEKTYDELDTSKFLDELLSEAAEASRKDGRRIALLDVGGYFAAPLTRLGKADVSKFCGVVEDTTFGHNRYFNALAEIPIPVYSAARSELKEIEARFVGKDAVTALEFILRREGISLPGRKALVIGYGMIGKNVARSLRAMDLRVGIYDILDQRNLAAFIDGFRVHKKRELIKEADVVYAATGNPNGALSFPEIEECKPNAILVSVGSRDSEFDLKTLRRQALEEHSVGSGQDLTSYRLTHKNILVAKQGTAVNFALPSIPVEVLDLVFAEIFSALIALLKDEAPLGRINDVNDETLGKIAKAWLRFTNS
jgi:adenosylhomocysteinase